MSSQSPNDAQRVSAALESHPFIEQLPEDGAPLTNAIVRRDGNRVVVGGYCAAAGCRFELTREMTGEGAGVRESAERAATLFERALLVVASIEELLPTCRAASAKTAALANAAGAAVVVKYATDLVEDTLDDAGTRGPLVPVMMAQFRARPLIPVRGGEKSLTTKVDEVGDSLEDEYPLKAAVLHNAANLLSWLARHDNAGAVGIGRQRV